MFPSKSAIISGGGRFVNNYSIYLDGTTDYINVADDATLDMGTGHYTLSVWAKLIVENQQSSLIQKRVGSGQYENYGLMIADGSTSYNAGKKLVCTNLGVSGSGNRIAYKSDSDIIVDVNWHHYVAVVTFGTDIKLYIDGTLEASTEIYGSTPTWETTDNNQPLRIGESNSGFDTEGHLDEAAAWKGAALSALNVKSIYNNGVPNDLTNPSSYATDQSSSLAGYWRMEEGTGTTVADSSGNGNIGTLANNASFNFEAPR